MARRVRNIRDSRSKGLTRLVIVTALVPFALRAQVSEPDKKSAEWETLARALEAKVARMLPCDPRVRTTIEEVSRASEARLAAQMQGLDAALAQARKNSDAARAALTEQEAGVRDRQTDLAESDQERVALEGQISDLGDSVKRNAALTAAQKKLEEITTLALARSEQTSNQAKLGSAVLRDYRELAALYEARERALEGVRAALQMESARWSDLYAARQARAQIECSITNQAARATPQRKK
jgi:hypothetical protein